MVGGMARRGATKAEYALVLGLLSVSSVLVVGALGHEVASLFDGIVVIDPHEGRGGGTDDDGGGGGGDDDTGGGGKGKGKHGNNGQHGNPGGGNNGNDKTGGNAR